MINACNIVLVVSGLGTLFHFVGFAHYIPQATQATAANTFSLFAIEQHNVSINKF
jgi:hypothetical protein